ncbi:MAG TPA: hypothetical protein VGF39_17090, partial [Stellaceae bacterium]
RPRIATNSTARSWSSTAASPASAVRLTRARAVAIDGEIFQDAYLAPLKPESEIYLIPKIGGG